MIGVVIENSLNHGLARVADPIQWKRQWENCGLYIEETRISRFLLR